MTQSPACTTPRPPKNKTTRDACDFQEPSKCFPNGGSKLLIAIVCPAWLPYEYSLGCQGAVRECGASPSRLNPAPESAHVQYASSGSSEYARMRTAAALVPEVPGALTRLSSPSAHSRSLAAMCSAARHRVESDAPSIGKPFSIQ